MVENTKEIVIALINSKQICNYAEPDKNIEEARKAIREIHQELLNTKKLAPELDK